MRVPSHMNTHFSQVPSADIPRSSFDRTHTHKTTFDAGKLIPFYWDFALPGDTFNCMVQYFARLNTPIFPIMDNMYADMHFFAIPIRLIFDNFQKMMGEQKNPGDSTDYVFPTVTTPVVGSGGVAVGSFYDYLGVPTGVDDYTMNNLIARAVHLTWNEWYRDQNLQNSVVVDTDDGPDTYADYSALLSRGKRHDYFTSALPWPQKGPAVDLPLGTSAPVISDGTNPKFSGNVANNTSFQYSATANASFNPVPAANNTNVWFGNNTGLVADLSSATAATINTLREAFQVQKLYERDARGGTRYTEIIRSHFGVVSPDARLQRPEYLGGDTAPVIINPIVQTSSTDATTPQGNLAAMGTLSYKGPGFVKSFTEHTVVVGLISVRADLTYQQGLNRMLSYSTRFDLYWPVFSHLGEQAILSKEIYLDGTAADENVFGYQEYGAEWRYKPSIISGQFRSTFATSLDAWHLAQEFSSRPTLSSTFIEENPPVDRVVATPDEPHFKFDSLIRLRCARPMPVYSVPGLIDHF